MGDVIDRAVFDEAKARFLRHRAEIKRLTDSPPDRMVRAGDDLAMGRADPELEEYAATSGYVAPDNDCAWSKMMRDQ
ncbi:hypothetical protein [Rhodopseudomonas sp. B29]|uniref:hypothetical protein n=1 Tax=Rhodopseudomonas sp. B29 TaxID=95607 RepID=UPI00034DC955|nr:hypothetical protein [Rhodopseudomonas sp. B29]